ncbi:MAG: PAS domain S-box protein [Desulfobacteraceae bacterium]|nr:PAS domain S-box protein [Desulfobacteraceae bacterium]
MERLIKILIITNSLELIQKTNEIVDGGMIDLVHCSTGPDGLSQITRDNYDILLLDETLAGIPLTTYLSKAGQPPDLIISCPLSNKTLENYIHKIVQELVDKKSGSIQENKALFSSTNLFDAFMENLPVGAFIKDLDSNYIYVNPQAKKCCPQADWYKVATVDIFPEVGRELISHDREVIMEGPQDYIQKISGEFGRDRFYRTVKFPIVHEGEIRYIGCISMDITKLLATEKELLNSRREWENIFQAIGHVALILDPDLNIINANQAALGRLGLTLDQIQKKRCIDFFSDGQCDEKYCPMKNGFLLEDANASEMEMHALGGVFLVKCTPVFDGDGKLDKIIHIATEITVRKKAEEALTLSEEKYKNLIKNALMGGVYQVKAQGDFIMANQRTVEMLGFESIAEFFRKPRNIIDFYVDPQRREDLRKEIETTGFVKGGEAEFKKINGKKIWVKMNTRKIENDYGVICYEGLIEDITEMKRFERRLLQSQRIEAIGALAGGVAHDFNNILAPIIGYAELALEDCEKEGTIESDLKEILKAGKRAKGLVKQILTFARQSTQNMAPIKAKMVAKEALKFLKSFLPKSIEIHQNFQSDALIMGDATQIHQIFMNIFTNAAQAIPDEIGVIEVEMIDVKLRDKPKNDLVDLKPGNYLKISVSDTGQGILPEHISKIFEPYFTTKGRDQGTGMGLAVVHGIVKSYDGGIYARSGPDKGTIITIYLPSLEQEEALSVIRDKEAAGGHECIMLVDDEAPILSMNRQILEKLGYRVEVYTNGMDAFERFKSAPNDFDLVITDMSMPKMTGELLSMELLRINADLPIILLSGFNKKISSRMINRIGIRKKALKPVSKYDLAKMIRTVLDEEK